ncbi:Poly(rC)-binding protein 3, partial [Coemansia sp. RSA 2703]
MSDSGEPADQMSISAAELEQQEQQPQEQQQQPSTAEQTEADAQRTDEPTACLAPFVGQFESAAAALPITGTKRKRARKNTLNTSTVQPVLDAHPPHEAAATAADDEDINLHVDAGWSDDDKDDKDSSAKRAAAEGEDGAPAPAAKHKKQANPLDNFTVRAVVTRKDVDVVFEHCEGARERLEQDTGTRIVIVAGKDDPDIVVDRVLIISGQIDAVAAAYKVIAQGMLEIKRSKASASATDKATATATAGVSAAGQKPESSDKHYMHDDDDDDEDEDSDDEAEGEKHSGSAPAAVDAQNTAEAGSDGNEHASPSAADADNDSNNNESDDDEADENTANGHQHPAKPATAAAAADAQPSTETSKTEPPATTSEKKTRTNPSSSADSVTLRMLVPQKCVGSIMGHGGKSINRIREEASVSIHTSEGTLPRSSERIVAVIGAPSAIQKAITLMASALTRDMAAYNNADFYVPAAKLPSAMTVETNHRKRKDGKRQGQGYADHYPNNRGYGNRNSGFRHGGGNSHGGGYRNSNYNSGGG